MSLQFHKQKKIKQMMTIQFFILTFISNRLVLYFESWLDFHLRSTVRDDNLVKTSKTGCEFPILLFFFGPISRLIFLDAFSL